MGIAFGNKNEERKETELKIPTRLALDKIKEILEDSYMIKTNNKRYWEFWRLIEQTEKEL